MDIIQHLLDNNPNLEIIEIPIHSDEWYEFRSNGIGASEIGYVLRKSDWKDSLPVFEEKVGIKNIQFKMNEAMTHGTRVEGYIADTWTYFDPTYKTNYWDNINEGVPQRECFISEVKDKYFVNKKYPWLFASLDGIIHPDCMKLNGVVDGKAGVLEIKNQKSWVLNRWKLKVPPEHIYQIHQIMIILGLDYGEVCSFEDGATLNVTPIPLIEELKEDLLEGSKDFWYNKVLPAKKVKKKIAKAYLDGDKELAMRLEAELFDYEPEVTDSQSYVDYLAETALIEMIKIKSDDYVLSKAVEVKKINALVKLLEKKRLMHEAIIRHHFRVKGGTEMDFGDFGTLKLKRRGSSDKSTLYNNVKTEDEDAIDDWAKVEYNKLEL